MKLSNHNTGLIVALTALLIVATGSPSCGYDVTIIDDFSFPGFGEYDYGLDTEDIQLGNPNPQMGQPVSITANVQNNAGCLASSAWGGYSSTGRSCWGEWDFNYPVNDTVDISFRCADKDATVHWRVELDGIHLASPHVPEASSLQWKIVTIHDVPISSGSHTVFLGTYQMDFYPDYRLDWVQVGDIRIEGETYDRMGGNDPNPDLRGLTIWQKDIPVQIWDGHPDSGGALICEHFVGDTNAVIDYRHDHPGNTCTAHYIKNNDQGSLQCDWIPSESGEHQIYVIVDPDTVSTETDETNNIACLTVQVVDTTDSPVVLPTNEWINVYCSAPMLDGVPLQVGDTVFAYDPDGILCGMDFVRADGSFGFMPIYRDDVYTAGVDEGAEPGDLIAFWVNDVEVVTDPDIYWTANGASFELCELTAEEACQSIRLHQGWNLVSWNVDYTADIDDFVVNELERCNCVDVILGFDQGALTYDPDLTEYSTLESVDYYHGYWLRMTCEYDLEICGDGITSDECIPIYEGWNLVSYWPEDTLATEDGFASILECLEAALGYDEGGLTWLPDNPVPNTLGELNPGFGYWVKSDCNSNLEYPGWNCAAAATTHKANIAATNSVLSSRSWMSIYGSDITLDGSPVGDNASVEARTEYGLLCGKGKYANGTLKFMPVYGSDNLTDGSNEYPNDGDLIALRIDGERVYPDITWSGHGSRCRIQSLSKDLAGSGLVPTTYQLSQNYPNPFNPETRIEYSLEKPGNVVLEVYNIKGQRVKTLANGLQSAGKHAVIWDGRNDDGEQAASGVYFYRLTVGDFVETRKMILAK